MPTKLKICSWNVNGIRAVVRNGLADWLKAEKPDIVGLQEIKINDVARAEEEFDFAGYNEYWHHAKRPGYSGTAVLSKIEPGATSRGFAVPGSKKQEEGKDSEGRVLTLEFEKFYFVTTYFPNAQHELTRLDFKEDFNQKWLAYIKKLEKKKPVVTCGDFNVAHEEIDLTRPKDNVGNAGFTPEERQWMDKFTKHGLIDTFRLIHGEKVQYSWWSYRMMARARNIGWRIDYFLVSEKLKKNIKDAFIRDTVLGSDHCPIGIVLEV
ncbi:MAG TPA: exodeoxyribonuclease III [Candidatus Paceibacterota bacterium]|nr:exodeoxyribonuclease III [Candidatus Paceibacterota bacterium]